jgi:hypothetical protein
MVKLTADQQWRQNRRQWRVFISVFFGGLGLIGLVAVMRPDHTTPAWIGFAWLLSSALAAARVNPRCPRCGSHLVKPSTWRVVFFTRKCDTCGLPRED